MKGVIRKFAGLGLAQAALIAGVIAQGSDVDRPARPAGPRVDSSAITRLIDERIDGTDAKAGASAASIADDSEFLRRVYLDLAGVIPPADKVAAFLADKDPAKRAKVIDELLADSRYGRHQADRWETLLMIRDSTNRRLKGEPLYNWLVDRFNQNQPWDRLVSDLLTAEGDPGRERGRDVFHRLADPRQADRPDDPAFPRRPASVRAMS